MIDKKIEIYRREQKEATEIDKMATQIKKDDVGLFFNDATEEAIGELEGRRKITRSGCKKLIEEQEESSWAKSCFYLKDWQKNTKYKSEDLWKTITEMWTTTGIYQQGHTLNKHMIAIELGD